MNVIKLLDIIHFPSAEDIYQHMLKTIMFSCISNFYTLFTTLLLCFCLNLLGKVIYTCFIKIYNVSFYKPVFNNIWSFRAVSTQNFVHDYQNVYELRQ